MLLLLVASADTARSYREAAVDLVFMLVCLSIKKLSTVFQQYSNHVNGAKVSFLPVH